MGTFHPCAEGRGRKGPGSEGGKKGKIFSRGSQGAREGTPV